MRASATSRIASAAILSSTPSKADAGKADDASPFALLLNEVAATPAPKDTQNKVSQGSNQTANDDSASQDGGTQTIAQAAPQTIAKTVNPGKDNSKSGGNNGGTADAGSAPPAATLQQVTAQIEAAAQPTLQPPVLQPPAPQPSTSQIPINTAANTAGTPTGHAADNNASQAAAATTQSAGTGGQAAMPVGQTPPDPALSAAQVPVPQAANAPVGQNAPAGQPVVLQPAAPPAQASNAAPNSVPSNLPQPAPAQASKPQNKASDAVQNTVQPNTPQVAAIQPSSPTPTDANNVLPDAVPLTPGQRAVPQAPLALDPAKATNSSDKSAKRKSDATSTDGAGSANSQQAGTQAPVQPDAISNVTATVQIAAAANSADAGDDEPGIDEPGIEATGSASGATNGPAKAQASQDAQIGQTVQNAQAGLAGRQQPTQPQASGQAATSQTAGGADSAKTQDGGTNPADAGLFAKPWQVKPQGGNADTATNTGSSPADVKQPATPVPQIQATSAVPLPKPADNANVPGLATPQPQQGQAANAPAVTQTVQVSTPSPNVPALAVEIAARSQSGAKQFDIRLDPPELGRVDVRLSIDATGKASAHLSADQPQTLDLLQKDAPALTRALRDAGLNVSQNGLNFSLRQQQGDAGANAHQSRGGNGRSFTLTATSSIDTTTAGAAYRGSANGRLDIRV